VATLPHLPSMRIDDANAPERYLVVRVPDGGQGTFVGAYLPGIRGPRP